MKVKSLIKPFAVICTITWLLSVLAVMIFPSLKVMQQYMGNVWGELALDWFAIGWIVPLVVGFKEGQ